MLAAALAACSGEPVGQPPAVFLRLDGGTADSVFTGAPGETLNRRLTLRAELESGDPLPHAVVRWLVSGTGAAVLDGSPTTDSAGRLSAVWRLGTDARETQELTVTVGSIGGAVAERRLLARAVPSRVSTIAADLDTLSLALARTARLSATATDPFGNEFRPAELRVRSLDTSLAVVAPGGTIVPRRRGGGQLVIDVASATGVADTVSLDVFQRVAAIAVAADSMKFSAVGSTMPLRAELIDEDGLLIADSLPLAEVEDSGVATLAADGSFGLTSLKQGATQVTLTTAAARRVVHVLVDQVVARVVLEADTVRSDALGDTIRISPVGIDSAGTPKLDARFSLESTDSAIVALSADGALVTRQNGLAAVEVRARSGAGGTLWIAVQQVPAGLHVVSDSIVLRALGAERVAPVGIVDRRGSSIDGSVPVLRSEDSSVVVAESGVVRAVRNGTARVWAKSAGDSAFFVVQVQQRPTAFAGLPAQVSLSSLGESFTLSAVAVDSLGAAVATPVGMELADSTVAALGEDGRTLTALANGTTTVTVWVDGLRLDLPVRVRQRVARLDAALADSQRIVTGAAGSALHLRCAARDANGHEIVDATVAVTASALGPLAGTDCERLTIQRSGVDTLRLSAEQVSLMLPIAVAVPLAIEAGPGSPIEIDSFPSGNWAAWAPTLRRNSRGDGELYLALYPIDQYGNVRTRASLHRFRSRDLRRFEYDGVALAPSGPECSPFGSGIENVNIVPRAEGGGWRMFFAGGSFECYGWQVFSAVSSDELTWEVEEGVRVTNRNPLEPRSPTGSGWPVGEGMDLDRLPDGTWRMLTGGYEPLEPREERFQIVEWRSTDQLTWTYAGARLTHRELPDVAMQFVYAPNIREIAPGLFRMIFAATGSTGRLYSAVSTDRERWQIEGELMPNSEYDMRYVTLLDDTIVFIRHGGGRWYDVVRATVQMP
jgi:hypothetical protein